MTTPPLQPVAETIERSLSIRHVYGEPVQQGDRTFIPVAQVAYGFGAGGGGAQGGDESAGGAAGVPRAFGSGGGGAVRMMPLGVLELGPEGSRFRRFRPWAPLALAAGAGLLVGWLLGRRL